MFDALLLHIVFLLENCSLISEYLSLGSESTKHFVCNLSLAFLVGYCWGIWLNEISSEDRVKAVLEEHVVTAWLHLSKVAGKFILKLVVELSLLVFELTNVFGLGDDTNLYLGFDLLIVILMPFIDDSLVSGCLVFILVHKVVISLEVFLESSLQLVLYDFLSLDSGEGLLISLGLCFES